MQNSLTQGRKIYLCFILVLMGFVISEYAIGVEDYFKKPRVEYAEGQYLIVTNPSTYGYVDLNDKSKRFKLSLASYLELTKSQVQQKTWNNHEWIKTYTYKGLVDSPTTHVSLRNKSIYYFWVRTNNISYRSDFKKVTEGWRVKDYCYSSGDSTLKFKFKSDGTAKVFHFNGYDGTKETIQGHLFQSGSVVLVNYPAPRFDNTASALGIVNMDTLICTDCDPSNGPFKCKW